MCEKCDRREAILVKLEPRMQEIQDFYRAKYPHEKAFEWELVLVQMLLNYAPENGLFAALARQAVVDQLDKLVAWEDAQVVLISKGIN